MEFITRDIQEKVLDSLAPQKVLVLLGPRRVGKTVMLSQIIQKIKEPYLLLNGEDIAVVENLSRRSITHYRNLIGDYKLLFIDEAQKIPEIGKILKLMVDEISDIKIIVTGSSAFDLDKYTGAPLTGRKKTFYLFPFSENENSQISDPFSQKDNLFERLVFGSYPELIHLNSHEEKTEYLKELVNSYLLKDILAFENIRNSDKILGLLRLIAFQVGSEVSFQELGTQLSLSKNTVEKYLDLLTKVFVLFKLTGFSRNLRKEVTKSSKWYFLDNGLRNMVIANMNPIGLRNDVGQLWENFIIGERLKYQTNTRMIVNNYFWRTYDQQEIDWVEERAGDLYGYEFKWNPKRNTTPPRAFIKSYPNARFHVIDQENFKDWIKMPNG